jgi:hypothetical protein
MLVPTYHTTWGHPRRPNIYVVTVYNMASNSARDSRFIMCKPFWSKVSTFLLCHHIYDTVGLVYSICSAYTPERMWSYINFTG